MYTVIKIDEVDIARKLTVKNRETHTIESCFDGGSDENERPTGFEAFSKEPHQCVKEQLQKGAM